MSPFLDPYVVDVLATSDIHETDGEITGPSVEPLDLEEVKKARRFSPTTLDTLIDLWIAAARQEYEEMTGRQLITATREYVIDGFPTQGQIEIPRPYLQSVVSVKYDDSDGTEQTFSSAGYKLIAPSGVHPPRGRLALLSGSSWPGTIGQAGSVRIRYVAGYGAAPGYVPELVKYALLMLVGHFHKYGEEIVEARSQLSLERLPLGAQSVIREALYRAMPTLRPVREATWLG